MYSKYFQTSQSTAAISDELMIANMINALNNPHILEMLNDSELKILLSAVKIHVVFQSQEVLKLQGQYNLDRNGRNR